MCNRAGKRQQISIAVRAAVPGLADGESMDRDSLLPPALSESLHIPPLWLPTDHDLNGGGPRTALKRKSANSKCQRQNLPFLKLKTNCEYIQNKKICKSHMNMQYSEKTRGHTFL